MQDNVIGTTTNTIGFGSLGSIQSAGLYEIRQIVSHTESGSVPTSITINAASTNSYNTGSNSAVQIITFPSLGAPDYTTTANLSAGAWDGTKGGVLAFEVPGVLTLNHSIDADEAGFRGAAINAGGSVGCTASSFYWTTTSALYADKGEGIYRVSSASYAAGRAKILNGGGGGNSHNAGGGGGGNYSAGGDGGPGWICSPSAGGTGGIDLSTHISASRLFMGGGGGSGEGNNGNVRAATNGGGIIIIKADEIRTDAVCSGVTITANGGDITNDSSNDGNSGAGAGGTVLFEINTWNINGACPITVQANGGDGGDVGSTAIHGGGGGGGMGAVIFSIAEPLTNTVINTSPGNGGSNCTSCGNAGVGGGTDGDGIVDLSTGSLPVELTNFNVELSKLNTVLITWRTASEVNNDFFTIERSRDNKNWMKLTRVKGQVNSSVPVEYQYIDQESWHGISYYRLRQTDIDGQSKTFQSRSVFVSGDQAEIKIYPNPANHSVTIESFEIYKGKIYISNVLGQPVECEMDIINSTIRVSTEHLEEGVYYIRYCKEGQPNLVEKLIIQK